MQEHFSDDNFITVKLDWVFLKLSLHKKENKSLKTFTAASLESE